MKVGTDGVLLGAWVMVSNTKTILDIGTGTGLIALMLAQRSEAQIHAIEIDTTAFFQAISNFDNCKWNKRILAINDSFQNYCSSTDISYDLIVSNPPYFVNSYKTPEKNRNIARHADQLPFIELIRGVKKILNQKGRFCVILPKNEGEHFIHLCENEGIYCTKITKVRPRKEKIEKRLLIELSKVKTKIFEDVLIIEKELRHHYTEEYINLTKSYYINF